MFIKKVNLICVLSMLVFLSACASAGLHDENANASAEPSVQTLSTLQPAAGHLLLDYIPEPIPTINAQLPQKINSPIWRQNRALGYDLDIERPKIVVVIDDLGLNQKRSNAVVDLPGPLTLSYLPYSDNLHKQTHRAKGQGHELMVHMPMQPLSKKANPGPNALLADLSESELLERIENNLSAFDGYVGINNHMGSAFTQDAEGLKVLMSELQKRDVLYLDSRTSPASIAENMARLYSVATTNRDVFIDHENTPEFIESALRKVEKTARRKGSAIAIGHPHPQTVDALKEWLPTLEAKGFQLVPITAVVAERDPRISHIFGRENLSSLK